MPLSERVISAEQARHFQAWHTREFSNPSAPLRGMGLLKRQQQIAKGNAQEESENAIDPVQAALLRMAQEREELDLRIAALRDWEQRLQQQQQALDIREAQIAQQEEQARLNGEENGQRQGYAAGWAAAESERQQWLQLHDNLCTETQTLKQQLANQCLSLGVEIARKVLMDSVSLNEEAAANVLKKVHEEMIDDLEKMTLFVHPEQMDRFRRQLPDLPHFANARLVADASLHPAGFRIQHSEGGLDCSLHKRWQRALGALDAQLAQENPAP
jgi:flagellar assembly protein FliH